MQDAEERRRVILTQARGHGHISVTEVSQELQVAAETVRRDLKLLEEHGLVRRTHGGAIPVEGAGYESDLALRSESMVAEKRRIAAATVEHLGPAETVYIDEGYTPLLVAEALSRSGRSLTVVTASLSAAAVLAGVETVEVIQLGGRVRGGTLAVVDGWAIDMLSRFALDLAVIGANGISRDHGLTVPNTAVAAMKTAAVQVSRRRIFVGVHKKFSLTSFCRFADVSDLEMVITDTGLPAREVHRYTALGPHVLRV